MAHFDQGVEKTILKPFLALCPSTHRKRRDTPLMTLLNASFDPWPCSRDPPHFVIGSQDLNRCFLKHDPEKVLDISFAHVLTSNINVYRSLSLVSNQSLIII